MSYSYSILLYIRRLISYHVEGRLGTLADIARLEEGFFHDLKGLFNKRLGLPINKFKAGNTNGSIEQEIVDGAIDVVRRFENVQDELFAVFEPNRSLLALYRDVARLRKPSADRDVHQLVMNLERLRDASFSFYQKTVKATFFELDSLLSNIVTAHQKAISSIPANVTLTMHINRPNASILMPYSEYSNWRRIVDNFVLNAIEAVEQSARPGSVEVHLSSVDISKTIIEIVDTGVGMDEETQLNFVKRGFTRGKPSGQGLGVNEDTIWHIRQVGQFSVRSKIGAGTTIRLEIHASKIAGAKVKRYFVSQATNRRIRIASATAILLMTGYLLFSIPFEMLRIWVPQLPAQIFNFKLINPSRENDNCYSTIEVVDRSDNILWTREFYPLAVTKIEPFERAKPIIEDIDNDGRRDIIVALTSEHRDSTAPNGAVLCLGDNMIEHWRFEVGAPKGHSVFEFPLASEAGPFRVGWLQYFLRNNRDPMLLVIAQANLYPCQVVVLDCNGHKQREYWHSGFLNLFDTPKDYFGKGSQQVILWGLNNRVGWSPVFTVIGYDHLAGQSLPYLDSNMEKAREDIYYVFGHPWVDGNVPEAQRIGDPYLKYNSSFEDAAPQVSGQYEDGQFRVQARTNDGRVMLFDEHFNLEKISVDTVKFAKFWNARCKIAQINRHWTKEDTDQLQCYRKFELGEMVFDNIKIDTEKYSFSYWARKLH